MERFVAAQRRASAAPLADVCRVEDGGRRQLLGNARMADRWSAKNFGCRQRLKVRSFRVETGRSALPGRSRPAHEPRQRCQLHALVGLPVSVVEQFLQSDFQHE